MQNRAFALRAAIGIVMAFLIVSPLEGCSGTSSALPSAPISPVTQDKTTGSLAAGSLGSQSQPDPNGTKPKLLFVSDNENNRVLVFNTATKTQNPPPIRTITSGVQGPNGITTDKHGNLFVANYVSNAVTVYAPNAATPKRTITNGLDGPWDVFPGGKQLNTFTPGGAQVYGVATSPAGTYH